MQSRLHKYSREAGLQRYVYYLVLEHVSSSTLLQRNTPNKYIKNYDFDYPQTNSQFTVTAVIGHLLEQDFEPHYGWYACDPFALFDAPVVTKVKKENEGIARNLKSEARRVQTLMIWTDCDREGENIGAEIVGVCREVQRNLAVRRARFSAIIAQCVLILSLLTSL